MFTRRSILKVVATLTLAWAATSLVSAQTQTNQPPKLPLLFKATQVRGATVQNGDGQDLGKLRDFALDSESGRVRYVIVASGGFLGVKSKLKPVPPDIMSAGTAKRNVVGINITRDRWRHAPTVKASKIATLDSSNSAQQVNQFYSGAAPTARSAEAAQSEDTKLSPTAVDRRSELRVARADGRLQLASDFIGKSVVNRQQEKLGEVLDLVMAFDSRAPVFVVFSSGRLGKDGEHYAVRLAGVTLSDGGKVTVDAPRAALARAPFFSRQVVGADASAEVFQIYRFAEGRKR